MESWALWIFLMSAAAAVRGQDCGVVPLNTGRGRTVGDTKAGSWPWLVSIHHNFTGSHICGGTLICAEWILTSAQCIVTEALNPSPSGFTVYLGRQTQGGPSANQVKRNVVQIIVHPDYQDSLLYNGVALMKLSRPITFSDNVRPICLASSSSWFSNGTSCLATGLGRPNLAEIPPAWSPPQEAETAVIGRDQCRCQYERLMELLNSSHITDKLMCAQRDGQERRLCLGGTGAPLQCQQGSVWILAGISVVGLCALVDFPEIYTRVSEFQRWITDQVTTANVTFVSFTSSGTDLDSNFVCKTSAEANSVQVLFASLSSVVVLLAVLALQHDF